jgi:hypothetical protein
VGQQEAAEGKGLITQRLRIPQGGIAQLFGALRQLYQLRRVQRIGKTKHPFLT